ncbi:hypothetical protein [Spiroplasma endosymbiont of Amphimallon solstitiale]|uniref:hypothetical protein n=1 Tax=Spiroplasma endosymbiont of Amphimallon solstitiale TaxID=3066288 RepID=UPI00313D3D16
MLSLFKRKEKSNISDNQNEKVKFLTNKNKSTHTSILNYFGFNDFNHETYFTDFVAENNFNYVEKYGWPKIIHQFTLKILFLIKNLLKVTLFSVKIL